MKINFVLPVLLQQPIGGYKVVYEYANGLAKRGHQVSVIHPREFEPRSALIQRVKSRAWTYKVQAKTPSLINWFPVDPAVRMLLIPDVRSRFVPKADIIVATAWQTAEFVQHYAADRGTPFYLIYDYEFWMTGDARTRQRMTATYRAGLNMIATSPAVQELMTENGVAAAAYVPCGIDQAIYKLETPIETRSRITVGLPLRQPEFKGTADALQAATLLKRKFGDNIQFKAFGSAAGLAVPDWIERRDSPTDAELNSFYNTLAIFMFPSHYEGWGLPGVEALSCGAALATTDSVGNREYARDGETALVVPRKRPDLLADAIEKLLLDNDLRLRLAKQGNAFVQQYTWSRSVDALEATFKAALRADSS